METVAQPGRPQLPVTVGAKLAVKRADLQRLIDLLRGRGYRVIAPTIRDGAILYDTVTDLDQLPVGWTDRQEAGEYRLEPRADDAACLATRSGRIPGNSFCIRQSSGCGRRAASRATGLT